MAQIVHAFAALGDPTRFAIVERLMTNGDQAAGDLLDVAPMSAPAISRHLKVLREAGIIQQTIDKQRRIYSVRPEAMEQISAWTISHAEFWNGSLDRLAAALKRE